MPQPPDVSSFAFAVAVAGSLLGPQAAYYVGTYGIIIFGWFCGLMYGLYVRPMESKFPLWAYALTTFGATFFTAVQGAEFASRYVPFEWTALLFPVAFAIPAFPQKWGLLGSWLAQVWNTARGVKQ